VKRTDSLSPEQRRRTMAAVRSRDTGPELAVRRLAHRLGYRFRLHRGDLPGRPDLVFPGRRRVVFVHGCFWHGHDCPHGLKKPKSNRQYWIPKLERNRERDAENRERLAAAGWQSLVLWECELGDEAALARRLGRFLGPPGPGAR